MLAIGGSLRWPGYHDNGQRFDKRWTVEEIYDMVFVKAPTDMAMARSCRSSTGSRTSFAPVAAQHAMAQRYPGSGSVLWRHRSGVPRPGRGAAPDRPPGSRPRRLLDEVLQRHTDRSWRCDDEQLAYPMYERCRELGVNVVQFHKGLPFGLQPLAPLSPLDLERPARDFPDMTFIVHHLAEPFFEEAISLASRFPNVYLALSGNLNSRRSRRGWCRSGSGGC